MGLTDPTYPQAIYGLCTAGLYAGVFWAQNDLGYNPALTASVSTTRVSEEAVVGIATLVGTQIEPFIDCGTAADALTSLLIRITGVRQGELVRRAEHTADDHHANLVAREGF